MGAVTRVLACLSICIVLVAYSVSAVSSNPVPKPWPQVFHAKFVQFASNNTELATVDLYYDFIKGRQMHIIEDQLGPMGIAISGNDGMTYHFTPEHKTCKKFDLGVGLLRPSFLTGNARFLGTEKCFRWTCNKWESLSHAVDSDTKPFMTYWAAEETGQPIQWVFYSSRTMYVMKWTENEIAEEPTWIVPDYCYGKATSSPDAMDLRLMNMLHPLHGTSDANDVLLNQ